MSSPRRAGELWRRLPVTVRDLPLGLFFLAASFTPALHGSGTQVGGLPTRPFDALAVAVVLLECLPLAVRRRWPAVCLALVSLGFAADQLYGYHSAASTALPVALLSTGAHLERYRRTVLVLLTAAYVPLTVLAGLLVHVGLKLVNLAHIRELRHRGELPVYLITVAGVVGINLLAGIGLGLGAAILRLLWQLGQVRVETRAANGVHQVCISGALTFVGVPKLSTALARIPSGSTVEVDVAVNTLDHSGFEALESWADTHRKTGGTVTMEPLEDIWTRRSARAAHLAGAAAASAPSSPVHVSTLASGGAQ